MKLRVPTLTLSAECFLLTSFVNFFNSPSVVFNTPGEEYRKCATGEDFNKLMKRDSCKQQGQFRSVNTRGQFGFMKAKKSLIKTRSLLIPQKYFFCSHAGEPSVKHRTTPDGSEQQCSVWTVYRQNRNVLMSLTEDVCGMMNSSYHTVASETVVDRTEHGGICEDLLGAALLCCHCCWWWGGCVRSCHLWLAVSPYPEPPCSVGHRHGRRSMWSSPPPADVHWRGRNQSAIKILNPMLEFLEVVRIVWIKLHPLHVKMGTGPARIQNRILLTLFIHWQKTATLPQYIVLYRLVGHVIYISCQLFWLSNHF